MAPVEADVRLFDELDRLLGTYEAVVPSAVLDELDRLAEGRGEEGTAASVGTDLATRARTIDVGDEGTIGDVLRGRPIDKSHADDVLVALAAAGAVQYVVTNDRPLRDRVLARGVPVIGLRGRHTLAITEP